MKRTAIAGLVVGMIALVAGSVLAQSGAKALFYRDSGATVPTPTPGKVTQPVTPSRNQYMGLSYWIELIARDEQSRRVTADHVFRSGDRIKLHLRSNREGYLYVVNTGSTGRTYMLFPNAITGAGNNSIRSQEIYTVPANAFIRFDENPGEEALLVMLSPRPMEGVAPQADTAANSVSSEDAARLLMNAKAKGAKDLVLEVDAASPSPATYAVAPLTALSGDGTIITLQITLKHR